MGSIPPFFPEVVPKIEYGYPSEGTPTPEIRPKIDQGLWKPLVSRKIRPPAIKPLFPEVGPAMIERLDFQNDANNSCWMHFKSTAQTFSLCNHLDCFNWGILQKIESNMLLFFFHWLPSNGCNTFYMTTAFPLPLPHLIIYCFLRNVQLCPWISSNKNN